MQAALKYGHFFRNMVYALLQITALLFLHRSIAQTISILRFRRPAHSVFCYSGQAIHGKPNRIDQVPLLNKLRKDKLGQLDSLTRFLNVLKAGFISLHGLTNHVISSILLSECKVVRMIHAGVCRICRLKACVQQLLRHQHILIGQNRMIKTANRQISLLSVGRKNI